MADWMLAMVMLSPGSGRAAGLRALRRESFTGRWVDHSARRKTVTLRTTRGRVAVAYDRAIVCGAPMEGLWTREHVGLALATFGREVRVRRWVDEGGDVVVEIVPVAPRAN